jgi:hypothetical protein
VHARVRLPRGAPSLREVGRPLPERPGLARGGERWVVSTPGWGSAESRRRAPSGGRVGRAHEDGQATSSDARLAPGGARRIVRSTSRPEPGRADAEATVTPSARAAAAVEHTPRKRTNGARLRVAHALYRAAASSGPLFPTGPGLN